MAAVHRYEGTVNQVMGDGIMALFGAPIAHEDHAVRACYAALAMQEAIRRYSEEVRRGQRAAKAAGAQSGVDVSAIVADALRQSGPAIESGMAAVNEAIAREVASRSVAAKKPDIASGAIIGM